MARRARDVTVGWVRPVLPDPFYYLNNFRMVLASLESRYRELLSGEEQEFIRQFAALPEPSCALLVRMIMRVGMFFRLTRLEYPEIGDTAAAVAPLLEIGWVEEPVLDVSELHRLLTKAELSDHLAVPRDLWRLNKSELLDVLREQYTESRPFHGWCAQLNDRVLRPGAKPLAERFRVMFFGNFRQDWTEFVLSDLGISSYGASQYTPRRFALERTLMRSTRCIGVSGRSRRATVPGRSLRGFHRPSPIAIGWRSVSPTPALSSRNGL